MDDLLNNAPCGFLVFTDDGCIKEINAFLLDLLGYDREDLIGLHIEKILSIAGRIFYHTHFFPLLKLQDKVEEIYLDLRAQNGERLPVLINAARRERGDQMVNDCVLVPVRRRSEFEDELLRAKKQAEAATVAKDEFLSVVSHELRTPLNAILGWSKMLQNDQIGPEILQKGLATIRRNAQAQTQLIEDILDFSRIISGKLRLETGLVKLKEVVEAAIDTISPAAAAKSIAIEKLLSTECEISGDPDRLQQVLWNILTNAVKFTPHGGKINVALRQTDSNVEISVSDTGKGITADFLPYIFERFQQQDASRTRRYGGLGLGMAITRHIVELHGGTIRAESPGEGLGATFTLSLPSACKSQAQPSEIGSANDLPVPDSGSEEPSAVRLSGVRVLVVDDEEDDRELVRFILAKHGAVVSTAASAAEAVENFRSFSPDLVISDIEMPGEDGFALISKLKEFDKRQSSQTPAIALTAHVQTADRLKVLTAGYQVHLAKPVEPAELLAVVANFAAWKSGN